MQTATVAAVEGDVDGTSSLAAVAATSRTPSPRASVDEAAEDIQDERSALLPGKPNSSVERDAAFIESEFQDLPWWRRPSVLWILPPFLPFTVAFGGGAVPKLNLILTMICQNYLADRAIEDPAFTYLPVIFGESNEQCRIPEVQSRASTFQLALNIIIGTLSAVASPRLGALSDEYGRIKIISLAALGVFVGDILTVVVASRPDVFHVNFLLLAALFDGLFGSVTTTIALTQSYAADCSPPERRNVSFGYFHGVLFCGIALGPLGAGYLIRLTGNVLIVFYAVLGCDVFFLLCMLLVVPESVSKDRQQQHRAKRQLKDTQTAVSDTRLLSRLNPLNLLKPLSILFPMARTSRTPSTPGNGATIRHVQRNLIILAGIDASIFGVAMGTMSILILYAEYMFGWGNFESSIFVSLTSSTRVLVLLALLPTVTRLVRGRQGQSGQANTGADTLDIVIIRISVVLDMLGYIGYSVVRSGPLLMLSGAVAASGAMISPTLQSSLTKHVSADRTGQLLGATGLLHALARVVAPAVFNLIYSLTVGSFPQTVFVCLAGLIFLAFVASFFLKAHVYMNSSTPVEETESRDEEVNQEET